MCLQDGQLEEKVRGMSNLLWLRLNRSQFTELPNSMDCFPKLVSNPVCVCIIFVLVFDR